MSKLTSNNNNDDQNQPRPPLVNLPVEQDEWLELENLSGGGQPKNKTALQRRQARSIALQTLFEGDATNHPPLEVLNRHLEIGGLTSDSVTAQFARLLVRGVGEQRQKLDDMIALAAPNWPVDQMAKVDKNILRLAIFEILFNNDVPTRAAINEAIELAKSFGSDSSSRFVNGVLGAIVTQQLKEQPEAQD